MDGTIKFNKIRLERNTTDLMMAKELVEAGVSRKDIKLAIPPPHVKRDTGFATERNDAKPKHLG
jgi:XisI protein